MKTHFYLFIYILFFFSCTNTNKQSQNNLSQVLPTSIHEGDNVIINAIKDSINIDVDSLFFHITVFKQDFSSTRGYVKIKNNQAIFKMPKNAAYITGYFYNLAQGSDSKEYNRFIYSIDNKPVPNAYQREQSKKNLEKELNNHPHDLSIYGSYIEHLRVEAYLGRESDSLVKETANKYLAVIEPKVDLKKEKDLYSLVILYMNSGLPQKTKETLVLLAEKFPNSNLLREAKLSFRFTNRFFRKQENIVENKSVLAERSFLDSLNSYIAKVAPHSPSAVWQSSLQNGIGKTPKIKHYTSEQMTQNMYYSLKHIDSTNINTIAYLVGIKLLANQLDSAHFLAQKHLIAIQNNLDIHYIPNTNYKPERHYINLRIAYELLAEVSEVKGDLERSLLYVDSAYVNLQKAGKYAMSFNFCLTKNQYTKAHLQRKTKQPAAALKTYSELYQELQDERILDSIKLVFEEQDQIEGYKNYIENLKNKTEGKEKVLKIIPKFSIKDTKGNLYTDKNLKGAVVVLNFWGVHCSPCVREIPVMNEFWEATQGHEIVYLAITRDKALAVERFGRRQKEMFKFPVVATNQAFFDTFGVQLIPTQIIINPKGEIIYTQVGATKYATQNLKKVLEKELEIDTILIE